MKPAVKIKSVLSVVDDLEARADKLIKLANSLRKEYQGVDSLEVEEEFRELQHQVEAAAPDAIVAVRKRGKPRKVNNKWKFQETQGKTLADAIMEIMPVGHQLRAADVADLLERDGFKGVQIQSVLAELSKRHLQGLLARPDKGVYMKMEDK